MKNSYTQKKKEGPRDLEVKKGEEIDLYNENRTKPKWAYIPQKQVNHFKSAWKASQKKKRPKVRK